MWLTRGPVVDQRQVAPGYFVTRFQAPEIARAARPGQFVQVRCADLLPLLPRPFSIMRCCSADGTFEILYRVVGPGTKRLARTRPGQSHLLWGPLGNGFSERMATLHLVVGGGVGIPPLLMLVDERLQSGVWSSPDVKVLLGARTAGEVVCASDFQAYGMGIVVATDDGSWGHAGMVTDLLHLELMTAGAMFSPDQICVYACGPQAMLKAAAQMCSDLGVACQTCLEAPMPCGIGVCMGCAVATRPPNGNGNPAIVYQRVCREGPVFDGREVVWA